MLQFYALFIKSDEFKEDCIMSDLLKKLKKIDKKILGGVGLGVLLAVALIVGWIIIGNDKPANDIDKHNSAGVNHELETENQDNENQTEQDGEMESENQTQDSDNPNNSENSATETDDDSNVKSEQSDKHSEPKEDEKPSTSGKTPSNEQKPSGDNKKDESDELENSENDSKDDSEDTPATETYSVNVYSAGGHRLYNVKVNVYTDSSMKSMVSSASTNSSGKATLKLVPSNNYVFTLSNVAEGYQLKSSYTFSGKTANVILESNPIRGKDISTAKFRVGDVMYDFSVTNTRGQTITLSEFMKTKKMVMLNFWYVNCEFCVAEFPAMSSAYSKYAKNIEIIALNPFDNMDVVKGFLVENPLRFQVATCSNALPSAFGINAYPVSVIKTMTSH